MTEVIYLKSSEKHKELDELKKRVALSIPYFPELDVVYVGVFETEHFAKAGLAFFEVDVVCFPTAYAPPFYIIFHELMHLVAYKTDSMPSRSENFVDVSCISRMPDMFVDDDVKQGIFPPVYSPDLCKRVMFFKNSGKKGYMKHLNKMIDRGYGAEYEKRVEKYYKYEV